MCAPKTGQPAVARPWGLGRFRGHILRRAQTGALDTAHRRASRKNHPDGDFRKASRIAKRRLPAPLRQLSPFRSQFSAVPMARRRSLGTATAQALCLCRWSILPRRQKTGFSPQRKAGFQHLQREPENAQCGSRKTRPPQLGITPPRGPRR